MSIDVIEIALGVLIFVLALSPGTLYEGRLGRTLGQGYPGRKPIEPQWAARLVLIVIGLAVILDAVWKTFSR
ncbi:MAG: hypothetical protein LAP21_08655 [Acidobacteriia bacterium]|nr:hypothetical protein [Terriglobia bacterium]